jgi:flagellar basal body-associated protein FliL
MRKWLGTRSTGDLLVLLIASTICFFVVATGVALAFLAFIHPEQDTSHAAQVVIDVINMLFGLMAGFLAGRTDYLRVREEREMLKDAREQGELEGQREAEQP